MSVRLPKTWDDPTVASLLRLRGEGLSGSAIGKQIGVSEAAVHNKLVRMGLRSTAPAVKQPKSNRVRMDYRNMEMSAERRIAGADPLPAMHPISWGVLLQHTPTLRRRRP